MDYKGVPLRRVKNWDLPEHIGLGMYLENMLWPLGEGKVVGSFKKGTSYHDIDVTLRTNIETERTVINYMREKVVPRWREVSSVPIDLFVYGNFNAHTVKERKLTIFFNKPENRKWQYLKIMSRKFWRSLWDL